MSANQEVLYSVKDRVARVLINRPEAHNSLTPEVMAGIQESLERAAGDPQVGALVIRGAGGKAFCAGADLGSGLGMADFSFLDRHRARARYADLLLSMLKTPKPILGAVEGYCMAGGVGLCLACDLAIATEDAQFALPEIKRGLWPYMVTALLIRHVGPKKALELCMTGERISASEAERMGMVNRVVGRGEFDQVLEETARKLGSFSPAVMALGKSSFYSMADLPLERALEYLCSQLSHNTQLEDMAEGIAAFLQKREPLWKGK
jgi:enoyl-CoA hydratase